MIKLLFKRQLPGKGGDTGVGWKRMPSAGSHEALLATELSAVLPLAGATNGLHFLLFKVGGGTTVQEVRLLHSILLLTNYTQEDPQCLRSHI